MLDHKSTLDVIVHLEKNIDLEKINYLGINVWPLVRLAIYQERHTDFPYSNKGSNTVVDYLKIFYTIMTSLGLLFFLIPGIYLINHFV